MLKIGLTGGIGSGKSTVAKLFADYGVAIIDADVIAQQLTTPDGDCYQRIAAHFGDQILNPDRTLNRKLLRQYIFDHAKERLWLEALLHPAIIARVKSDMEKTSGQYCIAVIPLLLENSRAYLFDRILVVDSSVELQRQRALQRDGTDAASIDKIIQQQCSREQRLAAADDIIVNVGNLETLQKQVAALHLRYQVRAA